MVPFCRKTIECYPSCFACFPLKRRNCRFSTPDASRQTSGTQQSLRPPENIAAGAHTRTLSTCILSADMPKCAIFGGCSHPVLPGGQPFCKHCKALVHNLCFQKANAISDKHDGGIVCGHNGAVIRIDPGSQPAGLKTFHFTTTSGRNVRQGRGAHGRIRRSLLLLVVPAVTQTGTCSA